MNVSLPNKDYFLDNYGSCVLQSKCSCLTNGWLGQQCPNWVPQGSESFTDLQQSTIDELNRRKQAKCAR